MNYILKQQYQEVINKHTKTTTKENKKMTRRFSIEQDFMDFHTNDILFGFMRSISTVRLIIDKDSNKAEYREYLPIKTLKENKKLIASICNCSSKTIDRHLDKLAEAGLIDEGIEVITKSSNNGIMEEIDIPCFWFPYDYNGRYQIIDKGIVEHLVYTRNTNAIRIFIYLYNKYLYKKNYVFTIEELAKVLGYSNKTQSCNKMIASILSSYKAEGLINYNVKTFTEEVNNKIIPVKRMVLQYVCGDANELPVL